MSCVQLEASASFSPTIFCDVTRLQDLETMSREMDLWMRDAQVQQQRYDDERRKTEVELEPLMIKLQVVFLTRLEFNGCVLNALTDCAGNHG